MNRTDEQDYEESKILPVVAVLVVLCLTVGSYFYAMNDGFRRFVKTLCFIAPPPSILQVSDAEGLDEYISELSEFKRSARLDGQGDTDASKLGYVGAGHDFRVSPDGQRLAYLDAALWIGRYRLRWFDVGTKKKRTLACLSEGDPGSGLSFVYGWSKDSNVLFLFGWMTLEGNVGKVRGTSSFICDPEGRIFYIVSRENNGKDLPLDSFE